MIGDFADLSSPLLWRERLDEARSYREDRAEELGWKRARDAYVGKFLEVAPTQDTVVLNYPFAYVTSLIPSIYGRQPAIVVRHTREVDRLSAIKMQALLAYYIKRSNFSREVRRALLDAILVGHGWLKIGWFTRFGTIPGEGVEKTVEEPKRAKGGLEKVTAERSLYLQEQHVFTTAVPPEKILLDYRATRWPDCRWIAQEIVKPYDYVMADPFFEHKDKIRPTLRLLGNEISPRASSSTRYDDRDYVRYYEIWDLDSKTARVLAEGSDEWQRDEKWPYPFLDGLPFVQLQSCEALDDLYPQSLIVPWLDQVVELSKIRSAQIDHIKRMPNKIIFERGAMTPDQVRKVLDPTEHCVEVLQFDRITPFVAMTPNPAMYMAEERVKEDILTISGWSQFEMGEIPRRTTATVGLIAQRASALRNRWLIENLREFILDAARMIALILQNRLTLPQRVQILGPWGIEIVEVAPEEIRSEFLYDMDVNEMAPLAREVQQKEALDLLSVSAMAPELRRHRVLEDVLLAYGKTDPTVYLWPEAGPPLDPEFENSLMALHGRAVQPNPSEDFALHLRSHNDFLERPEIQTIVRNVPQVGSLFLSHIQQTAAMARERQGMAAAVGGNGSRSPGILPGLQAGRPLTASATPRRGIPETETRIGLRRQ